LQIIKHQQKTANASQVQTLNK